MMNDNMKKIPAEKFAFVQQDKKIYDKKLETKPIGYFKDAWLRFKKDKSAVIAMWLIILLLLFVLGMILDSDVNTLLLTPIFVPIIESAGIDPVHFGVMIATLLTVGVMTPPVGTACYIVCGILGCPVEEYIKESIPFFIAVLIVFAILIFFPQIVLFIPNLVYGV